VHEVAQDIVGDFGGDHDEQAPRLISPDWWPGDMSRAPRTTPDNKTVDRG
jgi:hypothetical protein